MVDNGELERFVDEYGDRAYAFALGLCGNEGDARELVQEAFVRLFDTAAEVDPGQGLESWYLTLLRNLYRDGMRSWYRKNGVSLDAPIADGLTVADALPDEREQAVIERLEKDEQLQWLRRALERLTPELRAVVTMIDIDGLEYEAAAEVLGVPPGTVRSRLNRARATMKRRLMFLEVMP